MSEKRYKELVKEYEKKNQLYPTGFRPWEEPLIEQIREQINNATGTKWAKRSRPLWFNLKEEYYKQNK